MVDLHDEGLGAGPSASEPSRRQAKRSSAPRRTRVPPTARVERSEDLSGGIPRPTRPVVTTVEDEHGPSDGEPAVPAWVNDASGWSSTPPMTRAGVVAPVDRSGAGPEPSDETLLIVPAIQPDEADPSSESTLETRAPTRERPARRQLQVPRRARVRRVTRVIRYVDPWGVFKVALVFNLVGYATTLVAGVLLWNVAHATGTVDNVERFMESFGWESFEFRGGEIFHHAWIIGLFVVVGLTGLAVLTAATFNLVTDLVGGMRVTVLEEEFVAVPARPWLRPPVPLAPDGPPTAPPVEPPGVPQVEPDPWATPRPGPG